MDNIFKILGLAWCGAAVACAAASDTSIPGSGGGTSTCGTEVCGDGLDNDCDEIADENCPCQLGEEQDCYTGPIATLDRGICRQGTQSCAANGTWGPCAGDVVPGTEYCDLLDNNCDGTVDNDCTPPGTGGAGGMYPQSDFHNRRERFEFDNAPLHFPATPDQATTVQIDFSWRNVASRPAPFDLAVRVSGVAGSLAQVFSVEARPFARIGTRVEPLEPDAAYRIEVTRDGPSAVARVVSLRDQSTILRGAERKLLDRSGETLTLVTPSQSPRVQLAGIATVRSPATR